jgi:hypothetical protein
MIAYALFAICPLAASGKEQLVDSRGATAYGYEPGELQVKFPQPWFKLRADPNPRIDGGFSTRMLIPLPEGFITHSTCFYAGRNVDCDGTQASLRELSSELIRDFTWAFWPTTCVLFSATPNEGALKINENMFNVRSWREDVHAARSGRQRRVVTLILEPLRESEYSGRIGFACGSDDLAANGASIVEKGSAASFIRNEK